MTDGGRKGLCQKTGLGQKDRDNVSRLDEDM